MNNNGNFHEEKVFKNRNNNRVQKQNNAGKKYIPLNKFFSRFELYNGFFSANLLTIVYSIIVIIVQVNKI